MRCILSVGVDDFALEFDSRMEFTETDLSVEECICSQFTSIRDILFSNHLPMITWFTDFYGL